jgi:hypothetical protein
MVLRLLFDLDDSAGMFGKERSQRPLVAIGNVIATATETAARYVSGAVCVDRNSNLIVTFVVPCRVRDRHSVGFAVHLSYS